MSTTILRLPAVKARTGLSRSTIYQRVADGDFPRPVSLGPRAVGWLAHEVDEWIADRVARRPVHSRPWVPLGADSIGHEHPKLFESATGPNTGHRARRERRSVG